MRRLAAALLVALLAAPAAAETPRPERRPDPPAAAAAVRRVPAVRPQRAPWGAAMAAEAPAAVPAAVTAPARRPEPRPAAPAVPAAAAPLPAAAGATSPRPEPRPARLAAKAAARGEPAAPAGAEPAAGLVPAAAVRVKPVPETTRPRPGSVCGDRAIRGETLPPITGRAKGCGIADPVRVTEVDGVRLSVPITVDCPTAAALKTWVRTALKPAFGRRGIAELKIAAHYACRTRNNRPGARISEHGRGRAVDISGVLLESGLLIDVLRDYDGKAGKPLRVAHRKACGIFGTTLGPGSDGYHENHLHFDTARHRNGPYCR